VFDRQRYATRGITETIPLETQMILWGMIDNQKEEELELDYLQVFELEPVKDELGNILQQITHFQEIPDRKNLVKIPVGKAVREKIYVIDSVEYVTMLLATEY
jgi:hypothetical protein